MTNIIPTTETTAMVVAFRKVRRFAGSLSGGPNSPPEIIEELVIKLTDEQAAEMRDLLLRVDAARTTIGNSFYARNEFEIYIETV